MSPAHRRPDPAEAKMHHRPGLQRKVAFNLDWHGVLTSQSQCARSGTLGRRFRWPADIKSKRGERDEADANRCGHDRGCRVRDHPAAAGYADLPGRNVDPGDDAVPAASASAAASAAPDDDLPRRVERPGRNDVPDPAAASAATAPRRRTGLSLLRRGRAGPSAFAGSAPSIFGFGGLGELPPDGFGELVARLQNGVVGRPQRAGRGSCQSCALNARTRVSAVRRRHSQGRRHVVVVVVIMVRWNIAGLELDSAETALKHDAGVLIGRA